MPDLYLIDGSALAYRSYYAFIRNPLINSKGENTSASYGFASAIMRLIKSRKVEHIGVTFDTGAPTFRHETYKDYKATRKPMPDDLRSQIPRIHEVIRAMGIPLLRLEGHEADDLMATVALQANDQGFKVYLVTRDKDLMQLVHDNVFLFDIGTLGVIDRTAVEEHMGVPPERIPDLLSLMGDTSDNIPGIKGIGPKAALELITRFGSFEKVLENAEQIPQKGIRQKVLDGIESARMSWELVKLDKQAPIRFEADFFRWKGLSGEAVRSLFTELEFTSLVKEISVEPAQQHTQQVILVDTLTKAEQLCAAIRTKGSVAFITKAAGTHPLLDRLVGIGFSAEEGLAYYLPVGHNHGMPAECEAILDCVKPVLADPAIRKTGHNLRFDLELLEQNGIPVANADFDVMIAGYLLNPTGRIHNLNALSQQYLGRGSQSLVELIGTGKHQVCFEDIPMDKAMLHTAAEAETIRDLAEPLRKKMEGEELVSLFEKLEMSLVPVLKSMETRGIRVDVDFLRGLSELWQTRLDQLGQEIWGHAGEEFNINSTQQLGKILFEKLGLKPGKKTKTGHSTDVDVLEELALVHPLPRLMLEYRQLQKLKSTYVDAIPQLVNPKTGRVHTSFNQTVTATGRLSSSDPNLQNIPIRTKEGVEIRRAFVPGEPDFVLLAADYSQIELRLLAAFSQDSALLEAFKQNQDVHRATAALVFGIFPEMVTADQRRQAKVVNFGVIYGMSPFGLARQLGISNAEAKAFIDAYFASYPGIRAYLDSTLEQARAKGYVSTITGRRRPIPEINSPNAQIRGLAERAAINMPIQGSAADMIKTAMIAIHNRIAKHKLDAWMLLQVHDELVFEVHKDHAQDLEDVVREEMEKVFELPVPILVEVKTGKNWLEAHA